MDSIRSVSTSSFYGSDYKVNDRIAELPNRQDTIPFQVKDLVNGPPITWKVFKKQSEALNFISKNKHDLMAFAFESGTTRLFLVAHPEVFWHYDCQRPSNCRCSYEIIPENTACKLYFDLEFNILLNPAANGSKMVENFISIVIFYLKEQFNVDCHPDNIINLDSSTGKKFSRHLIFNMDKVCFATNIHAGNFVNFVATKIMEMGKTKLLPQNLNHLTHEDCLEMIVNNAKHDKSLFCDLSVYSRNRHFRLYKSTKYGKCAPLLLCKDSGTKVIDHNFDKSLFLSSLITYISKDFDNLVILCFDKSTLNAQHLNSKDKRTCDNSCGESETSASPYTCVDNFITKLVFPGKIYRSFYFSTSKVINYDIVGNRFCGNIGRPHKSNNVKYIVDLKDGSYYQKCHDYECHAYKSERIPLPKNLLLEDLVDAPSGLGVFDISSDNKFSLGRFPSFGLSDEEIISHFSNHSQNILNFDAKDNQTINQSTNKVIQRLPSFGLSDEEIINHLSAENFNI